MKINHHTILITGGSSGIGAATCDYFARKGWTVFELSRHGQSATNITHIDCDVCDEQSVQNAIAQVLSLTDHMTAKGVKRERLDRAERNRNQQRHTSRKRNGHRDQDKRIPERLQEIRISQDIGVIVQSHAIVGLRSRVISFLERINEYIDQGINHEKAQKEHSRGKDI